MKITLLFAFLLISCNLYSQELRTINGQVFDEKKTALPGVTVTEVGNVTNGTTTDENGKFRITVASNAAVLNLSFIGFLNQTVSTRDKTNITVTLLPDAKGLEEVVVVGYSTQKRITATGSVSSIKAEEIKNVPTASVQNALVGRLPGFFSQQRSGQPGSDAADFFIRGVNSINGDNRPLIIVDDIEYTYEQVSQMNVNEIESISILKDAATTAIYGVKGANGVLVITTNRGKVGKPRINFTAETGINQVIRFPTYLDAYSTALLMNEATVNDSYGLSSPITLPWTAQDLEMFKNGTDPYGHPNVNWTEELLKKTSSQSRYNFDVNGGNNIVKYFTSVGYYSQNGILKEFSPQNSEDAVNSNYFYRRFNFRSNLDITPTKTLKFRFDVNGRFETVNNPGGVLDANGLFKELQAFRATAPFVMPLTNPDGTYGYANQSWGNGYANPITRIANGGYRRTFRNNFNIIVGADQKLDFVTQGLSAKVNVSYASNINERRWIFRDVNLLPVFFYNSFNDTYSIKNAGNYKMPNFIQDSRNEAFNNTTTIQASLNYARDFGNHHVYALGLLNQRSYTNGGAVPVNFRGITTRVGYDFKQKYLFEFNLGRNGNDLFIQKYGTFPAVSLGWNVAEEGFFKERFPVFDLLKLRGSYGLVGSDNNTPSTILSEVQYNLGGGIPFGSGANEGALVNPFITWEKEKKTNIALDVNMFQGKFSLTAEYFYNYRYDQLWGQGDVPLLIGQDLPVSNSGISENKGFDGIITYRNNIRDFNYSISANASYAVNNVIYLSEAPDYPYQAQTGRPLGLTLGYKNIGFYQLEDFGENGSVLPGVPTPLWSTIQPGDLKYADMNGDGLITTADQTYLSKPNLPTTTYGVNLGLSYKGISLSALVQGATGYAVQINAEGSDAFNSNLRPWHLERWTPATAATATYPRIGFNTNINNISWQTVSDFWFINASYTRLKSLELGYTIPEQWLGKVGFINSARIYGAGYNLLTIRNVGKFQQVDPEIASGQGQAYPNMANFNFGVQLSF